MSMKHQLRRVFWRIGYDISRYSPASHPYARMKKLLASYNIDTVLDIGANSGQFAEMIRNDLGYSRRIISFEPMQSAFALMKAKADKDPYWDAHNFALGDMDQQCKINIAGNSYSSSLLDMLPSHARAAPESAYREKEEVVVKKLDDIFDEVCGESNEIYMKIDTQGFESKVLNGSKKSLYKINSVQMEMSLIPLYKGEMLFHELYGLMEAEGYGLVAIIPGFTDQNTGQLLQVDGIFHRFE